MWRKNNQKEKKETKGEHKLFFICKNGETGENYNGKKKRVRKEDRSTRGERKKRKDTTQSVQIVYFE